MRIIEEKSAVGCKDVMDAEPAKVSPVCSVNQKEVIVTFPFVGSLPVVKHLVKT